MRKRNDKKENFSFSSKSKENHTTDRGSKGDDFPISPLTQTATVGEAFSDSRSNAKYVALRKKRKRKKRLLVAGCTVLVILLLGIAAACAYVFYLNSQMNGDIDESLREALTPVDSSEPFYMLLLGVDKSAERESSGEFSSYRCDTIILTRVDVKNKKISMVSLPRDLQITNLGGTTSNPTGYGTQKLNAAYAYGGPSLTVQTVSQIAGVPISHYAEIDFNGFIAGVNAVGGVEIDVAVEINDSNTGYYVPAGKNTLDGWQALSLCRSRHTYDYLGDGDALRTAYQRQVISAVAAKLLASDIATIVNTINTVVQYVDTDLDVGSILNIAKGLQGMDSSNIYTASMPKTSQYVDGVWYDFVYKTQWEQMMKRMDAGDPPTETQVDEATGIVIASGGTSSGGDVSASSATSPVSPSVSVAVRNGTEISGIAASAVERLKAFGYTNVVAGNADSSDYATTMVIYNDDTISQDARIIASKLGCDQVQKNDGTYIMNASILVVLGQDYNSDNS